MTTTIHDCTAAARSQTDALQRLLKPSTVAFVGLRPDTEELANIAPTLDSDAEIFFVSHRESTLLGRQTYASVAEIGRPIDAVFAYMSAARTVDLAEECADLDVGGMVLVAGAFAELGEEGAGLQARLREAAERGGMAMVGPNGLGYVNVNRRLSLTLSAQHRRRPGGVSIISQSGSTMSAIAMAMWERPAVGINLIVSAGNEAATDLADYIDYLVEDDETTSIALVIEAVRRPERFFAAVRRAHAAGKPVVALKLARNSRTQQMAASHTGALTGDSWVYDVAFAQTGIIIARDPDDLVDRISILDQIAPAARRTSKRLGVITMLGGIAALSYDIALEEGVLMPEMPQMAAWIRSALPGVTVPNPLDATGLAVRIWPEIVRRYAESDEIDALLFVHPLEDADDSPLSHDLINEFIAASRTTEKPFILANVTGPLGGFAFDLAHDSGTLVVGHGLRSTIRGLRSYEDLVSRVHDDQPQSLERTPVPEIEPVDTGEGRMLPFAATMDLLTAHDIPVAPYVVFSENQKVRTPDFEGPYVVKLADVPHRTEYDAVRLRVEDEGLAAAVEDLRALAKRSGLPSLVAVQPMVDIEGELIVGIQGASELGPVVVLGIGGVLVEVIGRVGGRMAPVTHRQAEELIAEFEDLTIMHGFRGSESWDLAALADIIVGVGRLASAGSGWMESLDINPLVYGSQGYVAVDGLCFVR